MGPIDPKLLDQIKQMVTPLLDKLGELGIKGMELAVRQNYVYAAIDAVYVILSLAIFVTWLAYLKRFFAWCKDQADASEGFSYVLFGISWIVVAVVCYFMLMPNLTDLMGRMINPVWYALNDVVNLLKAATGH